MVNHQVQGSHRIGQRRRVGDIDRSMLPWGTLEAYRTISKFGSAF